MIIPEFRKRNTHLSANCPAGFRGKQKRQTNNPLRPASGRM